MRVLVVEDDPALAVFVQKGLMLEGHEVDRASDGEAALEMVAQQAPDLVVLDLGLPCRDGTEVLEVLRVSFPSCLVLVLTGRNNVQERIRCLNLGADDFVLKPFSFHELMARCRALLRRRDRFADPMLRFGGLELNRMERTVFYGGNRVELTAKEFALLEFLMLRRGNSCSRAELLTEVWHSTPEAGTNVVDVYITYLRKKLSTAQPKDDVWPSVIETVRGLGYRMRDRRSVPRVDVPVTETQHLAAAQLACRA
ncbi:MAG: response regulator transcription factor [Acidobacteriota bacterium]|nr:response regulator transcription factor [Acidobacteriota bacterium]